MTSTAFKDKSWEARFSSMGDASEQRFEEFADGAFERWGINRPKGLHVPSLPARVRGAPDYLTTQGFVECLGVGRRQLVQLKLEKLGVLRWWSDLMPVSIWVWDSHKRRSCLIGLTALVKLIETPNLCSITFFDSRKLAFCIPADSVFSTAEQEAAA